ncbi:MAG: thioredoxin [Planctomycetota bacterium]|nr:MAG: thioredoxin [Planctomycetota bacterium]
MELTNFQRDVITASQQQAVVVDFHASWCGPCRMLAPVLMQLAEQGTTRVVTVDTDRHQDLALQHRVSGIPDLRLYYQGREVGQATGFRPLPQLQAWINHSLAKAGAAV